MMLLSKCNYNTATLHCFLTLIYNTITSITLQLVPKIMINNEVIEYDLNEDLLGFLDNTIDQEYIRYCDVDRTGVG